MRNDDGWTVEERLAGKRQPTQLSSALEQMGVIFIAEYNCRLARQPRERETAWRPLRKVSSTSAVSGIDASSATTTSCSGKAGRSKSPGRHGASASQGAKCRSTKLSTGGSSSTLATPDWHTQPPGGESSMLPLGSPSHVAAKLPATLMFTASTALIRLPVGTPKDRLPGDAVFRFLTKSIARHSEVTDSQYCSGGSIAMFKLRSRTP